MTLVYAYRERGLTRDITILDANGDAITPGANDKVRAQLVHRGRTTALLTVSSDAATANGSSFTKSHPTSTQNRLDIKPTDLTTSLVPAGVYTLAIDYYDNASSVWRVVDRQVFGLMEDR